MCPFVSSFQSLPDMPMYTHVLVMSHKEMGMAAVSCFLTLCGGLQCCWLAQLLQVTCPVVSILWLTFLATTLVLLSLPAQYVDDLQCPAEASSPPLSWVTTLLPHSSPSHAWRHWPFNWQTTAFTAGCREVLFFFFFFFALRINLNLNLSFFSSVASSLCSHHVAKPYSLLMDSIRRAGAVCSRVGEELPHLHHRLPFFKVWVKHCTAVCNCQCLFTNHHPQWLPKWLQLPKIVTIILRVE